MRCCGDSERDVEADLMAGAAGSVTILMSGATSGIGRAAALGLAARGSVLVLLARDPARGEDVATLARKAGAASAEVLDCDLSLMASVREAVAEFKRRHDRLDVLINDAAVFLGTREVTSEGRERMIATNYLGPFLLTNLLLDRLAAAAPSRVINVTAPATTAPDPDDLDGEGRFSPVRAFGRSKAADLMLTYALARRVQARGITVCAYHPGVTRTPLMKDAPPLMKGIGAVMNLTARTPERAAKGLVELALSPAFEGVTGQLLHDGKVMKAPFIDDSEAQERLWSASERLVGIRPH
jgi:NAD(P)-dependent dehydrogenase (short-subunit alcohol dehydrogenase family)